MVDRSPALASNSYYQAVNKELGATIDFQVNDGNTYGDKIQTVLASPKDVPDWVVIPSWNLPPRFSQAVTSVFEDLAPYLSGDKIKKYPNLANLPTAAWKFSSFAGGLYGLPYPSTLLTNAMFYRKDIFTELGLEAPKTADEYIEIAKELTNPAKKRWGSEDAWNGAQLMFGVAPKWALVDGALVNKVETDEYRAALEWTAKLFASGAVHPDAVAGNLQQSKARFESGASLMATDGLGSWHESLARMLPTNPKYDMQPMDFFAPDGGKPTLFAGAPASIFSFIKKNDDKAKIEELLAVANFIAAPFGTQEYQLINYGVEGVHFKKDENNIPQSTDKGLAEVTSTYAFLVNSPSSIPRFSTRAMCSRPASGKHARRRLSSRSSSSVCKSRSPPSSAHSASRSTTWPWILPAAAKRSAIWMPHLPRGRRTVAMSSVSSTPDS
ncbi:extracellular solute-binding protein [Arthrobacter alpinus]|nr:extracellular solute-binding protein [Arthrobacter alpinus]